ncbi:MAG: lysylphosphatidylglycerol synthase domain-containing protein [Desulfoprunum sp.]|nr:lysylphosphatidylglycerol synthase domain-containing protein [Desulfoprunum sp.]
MKKQKPSIVSPERSGTLATKQPAAGSGNRSRWLAFTGSVLVSLLVFAWIGRDIRPLDVFDALRDMALPELLLYLISSFFMSICRTWRYLLLLEPVGYRPGRLAMFLTVIVRNLFADLLPAKLGSLIYLWLCRTRLGISWGAASSSLAISFVFDLIVMAPLLVVVGLVIAGELGFSRILVWGFGLAIAGGALVALVLLAPLADWAARLIPRLPVLPERFKVGLAGFAESVADDVRITNHAGIFLPVVALSFIIRFAKYTAMYFLLLGILGPMGFGIVELPPHRGLVGLVAPEIAAALPVSGIGGFGAYEGTWAVTFHLLGLPEQMAKLTGVAHHLFTQAYGAGIGLVALLLLFIPFFRAGETRPVNSSVSASRRWLQMVAAVLLWLGISAGVFMMTNVLASMSVPSGPANLNYSSEELTARTHLQELPAGHILFDSNRSGSFGIYVMNPDGSGLRTVVDSPEEEMFPDIHRNGEVIVYARARSTNIKAPADVHICRLDGSQDRILLENATFPSFTADGQAVIAERDRSHVIRVNLKSGKEEEIFPLAQGPFAQTQISKPRISPDQKWVSFISDVPKRWNAWAVRLEDGKAVLLGEGCQPVWSADPRQIYHVATTGMKERTGFRRAILPEGKGKTVLDNDAPRGHEYFPSIFQDHYIFYAASRPGEHNPDTANYQLYVHDLKAGWTARLTCDAFTNRWPVWIPAR